MTFFVFVARRCRCCCPLPLALKRHATTTYFAATVQSTRHHCSARPPTTPPTRPCLSALLGLAVAALVLRHVPSRNAQRISSFFCACCSTILDHSTAQLQKPRRTVQKHAAPVPGPSTTPHDTTARAVVVPAAHAAHCTRERQCRPPSPPPPPQQCAFRPPSHTFAIVGDQHWHSIRNKVRPYLIVFLSHDHHSLFPHPPSRLPCPARLLPSPTHLVSLWPVRCGIAPTHTRRARRLARLPPAVLQLRGLAALASNHPASPHSFLFDPPPSPIARCFREPLLLHMCCISLDHWVRL